ncbi:MAG: YbgC/FadM family acyl-CoA thioesterase [Armatimonadia bacterium]|nr:YbgC/FadM family acyl-CoA thioesterase [Armatimonadia bacterium]
MPVHTIEIRPLFADTDTAGVVYYGTFMRYLEEARTQAVETMGLSIGDEYEQGYLYPVTHIDINYQGPAHYGRVLCITTEVTEIRRVRFRLDHRMYEKETETAVGRAMVWMACVDRDTRRPKRLSQTMADCLTALAAKRDE